MKNWQGSQSLWFSTAQDAAIPAASGSPGVWEAFRGLKSRARTWLKTQRPSWNTVEHSSNSATVWRLPPASLRPVAIVAIFALICHMVWHGKASWDTPLSARRARHPEGKHDPCLVYVFFPEKLDLDIYLDSPANLTCQSVDNTHGITWNQGCFSSLYIWGPRALDVFTTSHCPEVWAAS